MHQTKAKLQTTRSSFLPFLKKHWAWIVFIALLAVSTYLRFWRFETSFFYGWDQARDAWKVLDITNGEIVLNGPRTGIGHFNLGSLWYYYLLPFYLLYGLDPVGARDANILVNIGNIAVFYWVTQKMYGKYAGLFGAFIFAVNGYLIEVTRTPWNVSPLFGVSALIYYCIHMIVLKERYKYIFPLAFLTGLFVHIHFSFVFLPPIILLSLIFVKDRIKTLRYGLFALPLFILPIIPLFLLDVQWDNANSMKFQTFLKEYVSHGFHLRFLLFKLHDAFIQFQTILNLPHTVTWAKFVVPAIFILVSITERGKKLLQNYLYMLWFIVPTLVYTLYGGTTSEYYVLLNAPIVIYIVWYLWMKIIRLKPAVFIPIMLIVCLWYGVRNTSGRWVKPTYGGLVQQRDEVRAVMERNGEIGFNEGVVQSYLYTLWTREANRKK